MTENDPDANDDIVQYDPASSQYDIYECSDCDNVVLVLGRDDPPMSCHNKPMQPINQANIEVKQPDIREVLLDVFGLPKAGLDICLCVVDDGPLAASDVADRLGYDRSTVTRYLNKLVELGLLDRSELNREEGGVVNVYRPVDMNRMRRDTLIGFYVWAGEAGSLIEDANQRQRKYLEENPDHELPDMFWESFPEE